MAWVTGLGLCWWCLGTAQAQTGAALPTGQTWFVDNTPGEGLVGYGLSFTILAPSPLVDHSPSLTGRTLEDALPVPP